MSSVGQPRAIAYRWYLGGVEVTPEQFFAELRCLGGRAVVEEVNVPARDARRGAPGGPFVVTPEGRAALARERAAGESR